MKDLSEKKKNAFRFKQFEITQSEDAMKIGTDGVLLGAWVNVNNSNNILDIGAGTGVIAVMIAQRNPKAQITGVEIDEVSSTLAQKNAATSPWTERIEIVHSSIQTFVEQTDSKYDLIISNPPFFTGGTFSDNENKNRVKHTVKLSHHDLLISVRNLLSQNGRFALILPYIEGLRFIEIANTYGLKVNRMTEMIPKIGKRIERLLMEFSKNEIEYTSDELIMYNPDNTHTDEYVSLTKDFYLKM